MSVLSRPMLAVAIKNAEKEIKYPCLIQPKIDGIRCLKIDGEFVTRNFKMLPNLFIRNMLSELNLPDGVDGELIGTSNFQVTVSDVMTEYKECEFVYNIFD